MRKAILLPVTFGAVVVPVALFVISGAGTHMSPLLLYLPAAPWWLVYEGGSLISETGVLLIGCTINAVLLYLLGAALDKRTSSSKRGTIGRTEHEKVENDG